MPLVREVNHDDDDNVDDDGLPPRKKMLLDNETVVNHTLAADMEIKKINEAHQKKMTKLKKKLKTTQQKARRLKKKVTSLKSIVKQLKEKDLITSACEEMLERNFSDVPVALFKRMASNAGKGCKYSPELKAFALTLQFYSTKAYNFVRKTFNLALPHPVQIRKWYSKIPAEPGFTEPAFKALELKANGTEEKVVCSLMIDEMAIRKDVSWDGKKFRGYVDLGNADDDSAPIAKDALVFMVVGVNETWKVPVGYFFVDGLSGKERANLVKLCIRKLDDVGMDVTSCHFAMLRELGASMSPPDLKPYFTHPLDKSKRVYVLLDICHMLKLIRNTLGNCGTLIDGEDQEICWEYVAALHKLQQEEGLRLGNKLKQAHIMWWQQKMKVNLAAQTLSSSVADAIDYCRDTLKLPQFKGSEATVKFIRTFDHLFDILNSRNPCAKGFKAALRKSTKETWEAFFEEAYAYIIGLRDTNGNLMYSTRKKTGFIGFLVAIVS